MKSLLETTISMLIATMVLMLSSSLSDSVISNTINASADLTLDRASRTTTDEMQFQLRNASRILTQTTIGGVTYTTGASTVVVAAPAYDPSQSAYFLTGKEDILVFTYQSNTKQVRETISPAAGSARPARTLLTLGSNVERMTLAYTCRERFVASVTGTGNSFSLATPPTSGSVSVYVNGVVQSATVSSSTVTVTNALTTGDTVQIFYTPQTLSATAPINRILFTLQETTGSSQASTRSTTTYGSAQLRNYRN